MARPGQPPGSDTGRGLLGREIAGYRMTRLLGRGSSGFVFEAENPQGDSVALKLFAGIVDPLGRERFVQESRLACAAEHPNLVRAIASGEDQGQLYIAYELMDDEDLDQLLDTHHCLPVPQAVAMACDVARGLGALHQAGVIHRDVKPANVFRRADGQGWAIGDLGVAKDLHGQRLRTGTGIMMGTPEYIAPEYTLDDEVGAAADQYALGVVLYEALAAQRPFVGKNAEEVFRRQQEEDPEPGYLPDHGPLRELVLRLLSRSPGERFPSMEDLASALEALQGLEELPLPETRSGGAHPGDTLGRLRGRRSSLNRTLPRLRRARRQAVATTILVGLLVGLSAWLLSG